MTLKKYKISRFIILILLSGIITITVLIPNSTDNINKSSSPTIMSSENQPKSSQETFELIQDFEASTYFISPYSSPGENDEVFFSFMANMEGNYTLRIDNYPAFLTDSEISETYPSFDNPSGTDLWYIVYSEADIFRLGQFNFKMLMSEDKGKTWTNKLVKNITADIEDPFDLNFYVTSTAIAVNPDTGFMIVVTWLNRTELTFFRSFDNGTTWSDPIKIFNSTVMGTKPFFEVLKHPRNDVAIMQNGSILIVSESNDARFTDLVFVQSDNNGTDWYTPQNVTCSKETDSVESTAQIPKIQVNRSSGDYWLMWRDYAPGSGGEKNDTQRWAQFQSDQNLFANVPYKNVSKYNWYGSYDFYFDHTTNKFRFIYLEYDFVGEPLVLIENWTCADFSTNLWSKTDLGLFDLGSIYTPSIYLNYVYNGEHNLFFKEKYIGNTDIFHYKVLKDNIFLIHKGDFDKDKLEQIYWNGRKYDGSPIETSLVKVIFMENHTGEDGLKELYIIIDNELPSFKGFQQKRTYFNPLSSNITLKEIPWEILSSETCNAYLEVFSEKTSISSWSQVLENNWDDGEPKIFYSYRGTLYVVYQSFESGRQIIYLTKSDDMGITWSDPVKIYETTSYIGAFHGAAWGDLVFLYIHDSHEERFLYRSFDQGVTFQDPINIYDPTLFDVNTQPVSSIVISNNGTMFMSYSNSSTQFYIIRSSDLGINWTISNIFPGNESMNAQIDPILGYDPVNDLVHFGMILDYTEPYPDLTRTLNISLATFNVTKDLWSSLNSLDIMEGSIFTQNFKFAITRDNKTATPKVRLIHLFDIDFQDFTFKYKEFVSDDLGASWTGPSDLNLDIFNDLTSNLDEVFYIATNTDGNDGELFFRREGKLVRIEQATLSPTFSTEITFDGINDFGDYIEEGNYTYIIKLKDNAGNGIGYQGWFYADYNAPQITDLSTNVNSPIPRYDLTITVKITDSIDFTPYLYYSKDSGSWQKILMESSSVDYFSAIIPGDTTTNEIQYYVRAVDLAGNEFELDNDNKYYSYSMPSFVWSSEGLFKETKEYSSSNIYTFTITISEDLEYVSEVIFRYSYDEGDSWDDLELEQSSPEFEGELDDIPGDLRELYYKIIIIDIYDNEYELTDTQKIDFYPDVPNVEIDEIGIFFLILISATIGFMVAFGYIRLKKVSHEIIYQKILTRELTKKMGISKKLNNKKSSNKKRIFESEESALDLETIEKYKIATPFTMTYLGVLCGTMIIFSIGMLISYVTPDVALLILAGSLLLAVYSYMILMSRDITINIYLEKIYKRNIILEVFQMTFMLINIIMILLVGYTMDWFRYYLVESTFDFGDLSIPRLYLSIIAVFFTSLVLVIFTTYIQLRKTVHHILKQRKQGATENLLLFLKDQNSSRLITHTGYKTIVFLVTILVAIVSTTNLLTNENGILLVIILIPFVIAGFSALITHRLIEREKRKKEKEEMQMLFVDSKKTCTKCGEPMYLSNRFCGSCGEQQIFADMIGSYVSRCTECTAPINDKAKFCTDCGRKI
ncbi:MAG: zinc ribbon domain-containing protein [Promethearchaeota archaeon]